MAKGEGRGKGDAFTTVLVIIIIICCVCLILLTIGYWLTIANTQDSSEQVSSPGLVIAVAVVSAVLLIILAIIGFFAAIKKNAQWLCCFAASNAAMWVFTMIQLVVFYYAFRTCQKNRDFDSGLPGLFNTVCDPGFDDIRLWIPSFCALGVTSCACTAAYILCIHVKDDDGDSKEAKNYYS